MLGLADEPAAARYLMGRGMESLSTQLRAKRLMDKMESQYAPQEMLKFVDQIEAAKTGEEPPKEL
jgi:hypothetical protein